MLDLETTGLSPFKGDRVIEIGALAIERGEVLRTFHTLVNVRKKIPWRASKVHGITDDMLIGQPSPENVYPAFFEFISDSLLVAHNARFDLSFLRYEFGRFGMSFANRSACTLQLARRRFPLLPIVLQLWRCIFSDVCRMIAVSTGPLMTLCLRQESGWRWRVSLYCETR